VTVLPSSSHVSQPHIVETIHRSDNTPNDAPFYTMSASRSSLPRASCHIATSLHAASPSSTTLALALLPLPFPPDTSLRATACPTPRPWTPRSCSCRPLSSRCVYPRAAHARTAAISPPCSRTWCTRPQRSRMAFAACICAAAAGGGSRVQICIPQSGMPLTYGPGVVLRTQMVSGLTYAHIPTTPAPCPPRSSLCGRASRPRRSAP
jgi:hypothetical protein